MDCIFDTLSLSSGLTHGLGLYTHPSLYFSLRLAMLTFIYSP